MNVPLLTNCTKNTRISHLIKIYFSVYECLNGVILRAILTNLQTESKDNIMSRDAGPLYIPVNTQDYADSDDSDTEVLKTA